MSTPRGNVEGPSKITRDPGSVARFGPFRYDFDAGRLWRAGREVLLPPRGHAVLRVLLYRPGRLVDKRAFLDEVWAGTFVTDQSLSEAVRLVRRALDDGAGGQHYIQTVPRRGYRFDAAVTVDAAVRQGTPVARSGRPLKFFAAAGLLLAVVGGAVVTLLRPQPAARDARTRFVLEMHEAGRLELKGQPSVAVSPDGRLLAFVAERSGVRRIFLRPLDRSVATPLKGSEGAVAPFFAPSGDALGFFADGRLKLADFDTGLVVDRAAAPDSRGAVWTSDGDIVFASDGRLWRVPDTGRTAPVLVAASAEFDWHWPDRLSDGRLIATRWSGALNRAAVMTIDPDSGHVAPLLPGASHARAAGLHRLLFARDGQLHVARIGSEHTAAPPIVDQLAVDPATGGAYFAASGSGVLFYVGGGPEVVAPTTVRWLSGSGHTSAPLLPSTEIKMARLSSDASRIAVTVVRGGTSDVWTAALPDGPLARLTSDGRSTGGVWAPDGARVAFARVEDRRYRVMVAPADGSAEAVAMPTGPFDAFPYAWSPDGTRLAVEVRRPGSGWDIALLVVDGAHRAQPLDALVATTFDERAPRFSPDGAWVAYQTNTSGRWEIEVRSSRGGPPLRVSTDGGEWPIWRDDGDAVLYVTGGWLWSAPVRRFANAVEAGPPQPLLPLHGRTIADAAKDGRLLMLERLASPHARGPHVVLGWPLSE